MCNNQNKLSSEPWGQERRLKWVTKNSVKNCRCDCGGVKKWSAVIPRTLQPRVFIPDDVPPCCAKVCLSVLLEDGPVPQFISVLSSRQAVLRETVSARKLECVHDPYRVGVSAVSDGTGRPTHPFFLLLISHSFLDPEGYQVGGTPLVTLQYKNDHIHDMCPSIELTVDHANNKVSWDRVGFYEPGLTKLLDKLPFNQRLSMAWQRWAPKSNNWSQANTWLSAIKRIFPFTECGGNWFVLSLFLSPSFGDHRIQVIPFPNEMHVWPHLTQTYFFKIS